MHELTKKLKNCREFFLRQLKRAGDFYSLSGKEALFIGLMFLILLGINYLLIALHGFSLSYSKIWPSVSVLNRVFFLQVLFFAGHFALLRSRWYLFAVVTLHFAVCFVLLAIYFTTGTFFCESILYLVYDTTAAETRDFLSAYVDVKSLFLLAGVLLVYFVPVFFIMKLHKGEKKYCHGDWRMLVTLGVILLIPGVRTFQESGSSLDGFWNRLCTAHPFSSIHEQIAIFNRHAGEFTREMRHRTPPDFVELNAELKENPPVGVLVIGESAIRSHHSIFGYQRNTTPNLLREKENIFLFNDTIAVLPMTITALKYWLTDMTLENRHVSWTLFDALKKAGYRIDVITNQNKSGWADSPLQMIFATADSITYMHEENYSDLYEDRNAQIYDGKLLPVFNQWLEKNMDNDVDPRPRLVVIHLFGSHDPFRSRYPQDFSREFLDDNDSYALVNEYDTSILYTDTILGRIIDGLKNCTVPAYMIYFSDHGSVCTPEHLRTPGSVDNSAYEIPFLVWTNPQYRRELPGVVQRMQKSADVPLQADAAHYGLLEIMGIKFLKDVEKDNFLSEKFVVRPRTILEGGRPYQPTGETK